MLHNSLAASQRFISYILSLFDIQTHLPTEQLEQQHESAALVSPTAYAPSSSYFLSDSIVMVQRQSNRFTHQNNPWSVHKWLKGLSKYMLYELVMDLQPPSYSITSTTIEDTMISAPSYNVSSITMINQALVIHQHAHDIVHQLDHLRPSDQFSRSSATAQSLHQLIHFTTYTLRSHPTLALIALLTIAQEILDASSSELRRHVFYRSKWGRLVVLEMAMLLKVSPLDLTWSHPLLAQLNSPLDPDGRGWIVDWLELVCKSMAKYDPRWKFKHEYQDVVTLAKVH